MADSYASYVFGTGAVFISFVTNNDWIRYVNVNPEVKEVKQEFTATLVTDDDEDA